MFVHQMRRAVIKSDHIGKFDEYLDELPDGFTRILLPVQRHIAQLIGLPLDSVTGLSFSDDPLGQITSGPRIIKAELIATDSHLFVLAVQPADSVQNRISSGMLRIHSLGPSPVSNEFNTLCKFFEAKLSIRLKPVTYSSSRFDELKGEGRASPKIPSADELAAADALSDGAIRTLAIAVKQSSGLLVGDLDRQLHPEDRPRVKEIRSSLESLGIVGGETVVICRKTSVQVARVPDPAMLADAAKRGWRCPCGSNIDGEIIDVALSITDRGRRLLDGSHWLTILLIHHLLGLGIPIDRILINQLADGDEVDCIADINGQMALFELKDKEFNLGNAYSFGAKIGFIGPDRPVIVTTEYVGGDARAHFAKAQEVQRRGQRSWELSGESPDGASVTYIEGIENIKAGLMGLISSVNFHHARRALNQALPLATLPTTTVLEWLSNQFVACDPLMTLKPLTRRGRRRSTKQIGDLDEIG